MSLADARDLATILSILLGAGVLGLLVRGALRATTITLLQQTVTAYKSAKEVADQEKAAFVAHVEQLNRELAAAVAARLAAETELARQRAESDRIIARLERTIDEHAARIADLEKQLQQAEGAA